MNLEDKVQNTVRYFSSQSVLQVQLVSLQDQIRVLSAPMSNHKDQMVFNHRNGGMGNQLLLWRESSIQILFKLLRQLLNNDC